MLGTRINVGDTAAWKAARAQLDETSEYISDEHIIKDNLGNVVGGYYQIMPLQEDELFLKNKRIAELQSYLDSTDWYVVRQTETEAVIPEEVRELRKQAREEISSLREEE